MVGVASVMFTTLIYDRPLHVQSWVRCVRSGFFIRFRQPLVFSVVHGSHFTITGNLNNLL